MGFLRRIFSGDQPGRAEDANTELGLGVDFEAQRQRAESVEGMVRISGTVSGVVRRAAYDKGGNLILDEDGRNTGEVIDLGEQKFNELVPKEFADNLRRKAEGG